MKGSFEEEPHGPGGESPDAPAAETLARAREAKGLHPGVEGWWAERISPKIKHRLAEEGK